jgi:alpha-tubulin suppressor-like RCC1 family protein
MVLTDRADIYAWGRGFEGQLGLSKSIETSSTPQYIKFFYGKPVNYIAAGAFYSLAITKEGFLWGWGEAKLGQLGLNKHRII